MVNVRDWGRPAKKQVTRKGRISDELDRVWGIGYRIQGIFNTMPRTSDLVTLTHTAKVGT